MICKDHFRLKKDGTPGRKCFCRNPELIENYDKAIADLTQTWDCHHRKEEFFTCKELIEKGEYYDVPPEDLIFLTKKEHYRLDSSRKRISKTTKGKKLSEETKRKISEAHKGKSKPWTSEWNKIHKKGNKNTLGYKHSEETKKKLSEAKKGKHWRIENGKRVYY